MEYKINLSGAELKGVKQEKSAKFFQRLQCIVMVNKNIDKMAFFINAKKQFANLQ